MWDVAEYEEFKTNPWRPQGQQWATPGRLGNIEGTPIWPRLHQAVRRGTPGFVKPALFAQYALRIYLPFSGVSRRLRRFTRKIRGRDPGLTQSTRLPEIDWQYCLKGGRSRIWEPNQANGNIRISELAILAGLASGCAENTALFEIGTFDGRTTLNLAMNSPSTCQVFTLDLPPECQPTHALADGERGLVEKSRPGARYEQHRSENPEIISKIHQLLGDSAAYDFSPYQKQCSLVFVDGSHAYENALSDSEVAMDMVTPSGIIVWHDYSIWQGVTRALEELEASRHYGLRQIRGTSLVYYQAPPA